MFGPIATDCGWMAFSSYRPVADTFTKHSEWGETVEFRELRYALSVAKERSFTKAAARLNISQSAVSEQVRLLEDEIGFPLFRRTSHGVELTERGRTFLIRDADRPGSIADSGRVARDRAAGRTFASTEF